MKHQGAPNAHPDPPLCREKVYAGHRPGALRKGPLTSNLLVSSRKSLTRGPLKLHLATASLGEGKRLN
eukprot:215499-Pelagomonas_calceolata.AAC.1